MKCSECKFENPDDMKFCGGCGSKLEKICPNCSFRNPPLFKFCGKCGQNMSLCNDRDPKPLSYEQKLAKIQRYLPRGITDKILLEKDKIEGERKQVTVMFCDMEGFTPFVEELGPEESYIIMDEVYEILIHKVHDYGGTVNELTGDGILALFGAPIALEDAPQRSIRSAMAIHREMTIFSNRIKQEKPEIRPVKMRIGINTGPVVVGTLGNDLRVDFKAVGDTVNLASRLSALADPGTTFVTENTFKLTKGFFRYEALGERPIKGKKYPEKIYLVLAASSRRTRFDVSAEVGLTPFVSRERELKLLLDGFERVKEGHGKAFSIMSDAGVGKSRLLYEFRKSLGDEYITFLEGKCLSYSSNVAYHPIVDILKSNFNIDDKDDDSEIVKKVKKGLKILGADEASTLPYVLELFSVDESGVEKVVLSPEGKREKITQAIKIIVLKGSEIMPLIMAFEDLHWVDNSSEEILKHLLNTIPGSRVMLLFTYRPTFVCTWTGKSFHSQLTLNRLSEKESRRMLTYLVGDKALESGFAEIILEKTEGVPFFIEEFVKSLIDINIIEKKDDEYLLATAVNNVAIPSTIHDVIMARVDALPENAKELIQTGSVIEREFKFALIRKIVDRAEQELLSNLSVLKETEMLYERGIYPECTYIFKHALTREVIYDSIITSRRKKIHEKIGDAITELYQGKTDEYCGVLAKHYIESENYEKAARYSTMAAGVAEMVGSLNDAIAYSEKAVVCLEKLPETEEITIKIIDARSALGMYLLRMLFYKEAKETIAPIFEKAINSGYKNVFPKIYTILGSYEFNVREDVVKSFQYFENAVKISEDLKDYGSMFIASFRFALSYSLFCQYENALKYFEKAFSIAKAGKNLLGMSTTLSYLSFFCYQFWGKLDHSGKNAKEAVRIAEESGDFYTKALAYTAAGWTFLEKGMLEEAEKNLFMGVEFCEKINLDIFNAVARSGLGQFFYEKKLWQKSVDQYTKAAVFIEHSRGFRSWSEFSRLGAIRAMVKWENSKLGFEKLNKYAEKAKIKLWEGWKYRFIGEILLNIDDKHLSKAEEWIKKAIISDEQNSKQMHLGADFIVYSDLLKRKGDKLKAREYLLKAIEIFKECGAEERAKKTENELSF